MFVKDIEEDDFIMLSALTHFIFCERRCALVHIEQNWEENIHTIQGKHFHEHVDDSFSESRNGIRLARSLRLHSFKLGLIGIADIVEFHISKHGIKLHDVDGLWSPSPVEFKSGKPKQDSSDEIQLCAQALCLEEMLNTQIEKGFFFYGKPRRRFQVILSDVLRLETKKTIQMVRHLFQSGITPPAQYEKKCESCSLLEICMPKIASKTKNVLRYLNNMIVDEEKEIFH